MLDKILKLGSKVAGPLVSGGLSLAGGILGNQASAKQARRQMQFQERMANTSHQRQMADLRAAGLNPILAAQGGAPSPGGAQAAQHDVGTPAVSSAREAARTAAEIKNIRAMNDNIKKQNSLIDAQEDETRAREAATRLQTQYLPESIAATIESQQSAAANARANADYMGQRNQLYRDSPGLLARELAGWGGFALGAQNTGKGLWSEIEKWIDEYRQTRPGAGRRRGGRPSQPRNPNQRGGGGW